MFSWGRGDYGQLGRSRTPAEDFVPRKIENLQNVKQLCCGAEHNMAITGNIILKQFIKGVTC